MPTSDVSSAEECETLVGYVRASAQMARLVSMDEANGLVIQAEREESFMPLFDPTRFLRNSVAIRDNLALLEAFRNWRAELAKLDKRENRPG